MQRAPRRNGQQLNGSADRRRGQSPEGEKVNGCQRRAETAPEARRLVRADQQPQPHHDMEGGGGGEEPERN